MAGQLIRPGHPIFVFALKNQPEYVPCGRMHRSNGQDPLGRPDDCELIRQFFKQRQLPWSLAFRTKCFMLEDDSACDGSRVGQSFHCAEHDQFARSMAASLGPQLGGVTWVVAVYLSIQLHTFDAYVVVRPDPPCDIFEGV